MSPDEPISAAKSKRSVLFLGRDDAGDHKCDAALRYCKSRFESVTSLLGNWGDPLPEAISTWEGDVVLSYLSRWIVPAKLLEQARVAALNFHPAPPEYPGIGCTNFALYEQATEYGATCHYMAGKVDTGRIVEVRRIPIHQSDTVASLLSRTYEIMFELFKDTVDLLADGKKLPVSEERWSRKPISRREFNELCKLNLEMDDAEMKRRIRATTFGNWKPILEVNGIEFVPK